MRPCTTVLIGPNYNKTEQVIASVYFSRTTHQLRYSQPQKPHYLNSAEIVVLIDVERDRGRDDVIVLYRRLQLLSRFGPPRRRRRRTLYVIPARGHLDDVRRLDGRHVVEAGRYVPMEVGRHRGVARRELAAAHKVAAGLLDTVAAERTENVGLDVVNDGRGCPHQALHEVRRDQTLRQDVAG